MGAMAGEKVVVLGVRVDNVTSEDVLHFVRIRVEEHLPAQIATVNAEFIMIAQSNPEFARALSQADLATPDSAGVLWAMRLQGVRGRARVGGSDLIWSMSEQAARLGHRIFFLGGEAGVAARASGRLRDSYPRLEVAGTHEGSPQRVEEQGIVDLIRHSAADILLVAFGAPEQDVWIARNLERSGVSIAVGMGGSFDYVAGTAKRAPLWMQEHSLEWLWRLARQPWRWRRMLALPRFVWLVLRAHAGAPREARMRE
jgi:N-acetylglucosaminyldiphosphoundecaprenol N-acetyl-beta-D-mannosaminyltransferase